MQNVIILRKMAQLCCISAAFCDTSMTFGTHYNKLYNRLPVLQISMFRASIQYLVAASGQRRPAKPSAALCIMQSTTTCCTDCVMCPQAHVADSWTPQSFNVSPTRAVPQRRRFSFTHCLRWRSAPGGSTGRVFAGRPHRRPLPCGGGDDQSCSWRSQLFSPHMPQPDVGWRDSCQHRQERGLCWSHASGDNSHSVVQCNVQLSSVGTAAPSW